MTSYVFHVIIMVMHSDKAYKYQTNHFCIKPHTLPSAKIAADIYHFMCYKLQHKAY